MATATTRCIEFTNAVENIVTKVSDMQNMSQKHLKTPKYTCILGSRSFTTTLAAARVTCLVFEKKQQLLHLWE